MELRRFLDWQMVSKPVPWLDYLIPRNADPTRNRLSFVRDFQSNPMKLVAGSGRSRQ